MKRELEHKNAPTREASSRLKLCKSIIHPVWDISDSDYRNASYSLICPLCIISDPIAMAKLSLCHKIMFLISAIKVTPKVMQWLQSCLEDHVLHLEIDGVFSIIICTKLDCTLAEVNIWKSHLLKMASVPWRAFLWLTHAVSSCYKFLSGLFSPTVSKFCSFFFHRW